MGLFLSLKEDPADLLLLNNVNPVFAIPPSAEIQKALKRNGLFVVSFSNFMDETSVMADLILPVQLPLETWDEYAGKRAIVSTLQPAMGSLNAAPGLGDVLIEAAFGDKRPAPNYTQYLRADLVRERRIDPGDGWMRAIMQGGRFDPSQTRAHTGAQTGASPAKKALAEDVQEALASLEVPEPSGLALIACPSIRFFDGRGANRPWLCEIPDPLTRIAWQTPVLMHPDTLSKRAIKQGDVLEVRSRWGAVKGPAYATAGVRPGLMVVAVGQGHGAYGRYAAGLGLNPNRLLSPETDPVSGGPTHTVQGVTIQKSGAWTALAHTDGSPTQHGRKIALSVGLQELQGVKPPHKAPDGALHEAGQEQGLSMWEFPLTLPLPEGYQRGRDIYPPHEHDTYRWAMAIDLDRCIGCGACAAACYSENNVGVVGYERILEGREMAWLSVERYEDGSHAGRTIFLPMLCQHCDNAPCESVCPVFAPHHSREGINNQIYNRCIGTRFCSQNCPYKVRRFNWFDWKWPGPLKLQLNPDVTVRSKGVMEKCSFCVQRIKEAHGIAKDEQRRIMDGEVQPACLQTCPTGVFTFGNLMDPESRVRKMVEDRRAYQVMGYLNTKPAVIYLKKVLQEI